MDQKIITLSSYQRGIHLITCDIEKSIPPLPKIGLLHLFLQHTSAALCLNENADPSVRADFHHFMNKLVPEDDPLYTHVLEGADDMPAHLKSSLLGQSLTLPVENGRLFLGTWQGIYLCEFRNHGGRRRIVATVMG
jgi:secondary thiamine-phosphate synthase enzyme